MGLQDRLDAYPAALSGGQKQRVAIARAIVAQPSLVLADEPTSSLDKESGRQVVDLLQKMARSRRIPILLVTHDSRILDIADRIVRIEDGRVESGTGWGGKGGEEKVSEEKRCQERMALS
jgi:putative ABC transport system ATP-binding protein